MKTKIIRFLKYVGILDFVLAVASLATPQTASPITAIEYQGNVTTIVGDAEEIRNAFASGAGLITVSTTSGLGKGTVIEDGVQVDEARGTFTGNVTFVRQADGSYKTVVTVGEQDIR